MTTTFKSGTILGLQSGDIIDGRFRIGRLIGYGGQGAVLSVTHLEWERQLALKLPLPDAVNSPKKRERFEQEAETWIRLGVHPNIVRCWFVRKVNGLPGLFLDLIPGGSLEDKIKCGELGPGRWPQVIDALIQVAEGLSHAHAMGMIHRDIKPENLLVRKDGQICVTDFGLVKSTDREEMLNKDADIFAQFSKNSGLTGVGEFLGTPRYGAPEQWNKAMLITPATDVYALGVILYELICGRRPFDPPGENPDPLVLIHRHLQLPPPDPRSFQQDIPDALVSLALACLQKDPTKRPSNGLFLVKLLAAAKKEIQDEDYTRPAPVPEKDRSDLLNNAGVSLHSLGKMDKCRENLEKGLLLQADHPECLYNLVQLDRRSGRMSSVDSLQRLRRAKLTFPLALLCIEEGHAKLAYEILRALPEKSKNGLLHRTEGDALMYLEEFDLARLAYEKACIKLPSDRGTHLRQKLAQSRSRGLDDKIYFPSGTPCFKGQSPPTRVKMSLSANGQFVFRFSPGDVGVLQTSAGQAKVEKRPAGSSEVTQFWLSGPELLLQDQGGFELWNLLALSSSFRAPGEILACTTTLTHILYRHDAKLFLLDKLKGVTTPVQSSEQSPCEGMIACFNSNQSALFVLTATGTLGQMDPHCRIVPSAWPTALAPPSKALAFQVHHKGLLAMACSDASVQVLNLQTRQTVYRQVLPFTPSQLAFDASGNALVASSGRLFGVFNHLGALVYRGKGACALDSEKKHLLVWLNGTLSLFSLVPFRRIRNWSEKMPPPTQMELSEDGSRALTVLESGEFQVWEVDENHRVFERELLLTPGESYEDLLSSYEYYQSSLTRAFDLASKGQHFESYLAVRRARSAKGFLQSEEALALHWHLCRTLQRTGLEALWERMFHRGIATSSASPDGSVLALCRGTRCSVLDFSGSSTQPRFHFELGSRLLACHFHPLASEELVLFVVESKGQVHSYRAEDGEHLSSQSLEIGFLTQAVFDGDRLLVCSKEGVARSYALSTGKLSRACKIPSNEAATLFPLTRNRALQQGKDKSAILDLDKDSWSSAFPLALASLPGALTHLSSAEAGSLILAGFSNGTVLVGDAANGKVLFESQQDVGAITGIRVCPALAMGVSVSAKARLTIFDLKDGYVFQSFTAHSEPIAEIQAFANGRYITTRTEHGEFRLWETCWKVSEAKGAIPIDWMPSGALGKITRLFRLG